MNPTWPGCVGHKTRRPASPEEERVLMKGQAGNGGTEQSGVQGAKALDKGLRGSERSL